MLSCRDARPSSWRLARCSARGETTHARQSSEAALPAGKTAFGTYVVIPSPMVIEVAGQASLDFVRIDNYHNRGIPRRWPT